MKKYYLPALCLLAAGVSFLFYSYNNKFEINELVAPVSVNIEIKKDFAHGLIVIAEPDERVFSMLDTSLNDEAIDNSALDRTILNAELNNEYIQKLFLRVPDKKTFDAIDNISVFVGNKVFYWTPSDLDAAPDYRVELPITPYSKSLIKPWINWYGDLNFACKEARQFLFKPWEFPFTSLFLLLFLCMLFPYIQNFFTQDEKIKRKAEFLLVSLLLVFSLLIRLSTLTLHSSWLDDLSTACLTSNPNLPFSAVLSDPGQTPLYLILSRFWFQIFGWNEASGRFFSTLIGAFGVWTLYSFVKILAGRKCAFAAAALMALNAASIGFSNQIRSYILFIALTPFTAQRFFCLLRRQNLKNLALYALSGALLVNTHYYGVLFIFSNFIYYFISERRRPLARGDSLAFFISNIVIALSLVPYFAATAFKKALLNNNFNTWIPPPSQYEFGFLYFFAALLIVYIVIKKPKSAFSAEQYKIAGYSLWIIASVYSAAIALSCIRSMFVWRYFSFALPFMLLILACIVVNKINWERFCAYFIKPRLVKFAPAVVCVILFITALNNMPGENHIYFSSGYYDVYKEAHEYIVKDIEIHSYQACEIVRYHYNKNAAFYNLRYIAPPVKHEKYDVVYENPLHISKEDMNGIFLKEGFPLRDILKIRVSGERYIYKQYQRQAESVEIKERAVK